MSPQSRPPPLWLLVPALWLVCQPRNTRWPANLALANLSNFTQHQEQQERTGAQSQVQLAFQPAKTLDSVRLLPHCTLGEDTYELGERWNPNLPPFGVQVCVQCECIARQRKNCYEAKVTCRRIINECPIIDSCPDGKKPVTTAGQCCKSCQSLANHLGPQPALQSSSSSSSSTTTTNPHSYNPNATSDPHQPDRDRTSSILISGHKNERTKDYQSIVKSLQPCNRRDLERYALQMTRTNLASGPASSQPAPANFNSNTNSKQASSASKNDLNRIDSRLAFKSLDGQTSYLWLGSSAKLTPNGPQRTLTQPTDDNLNKHDHHLHPNDVQSSAKATKVNLNNTPVVHPPNTCLLGKEIFQVGDRWNPVLPPFGVQVCVQCNCIIRQRRACYEAKVTCRRLNSDCPVIDVCPDGEKPAVVAGQCCKSCQNDKSQRINEVMIIAQRKLHDKAILEFQSIMRSLPACSKLKETDSFNIKSTYSNNVTNHTNATTNTTSINIANHSPPTFAPSLTATPKVKRST